MAKVSQELRETILENTHINEVYFTAKGHHYFNVHEFKGEKYARVHKETKVKDGAKFHTETPILDTKIVEVLTREQILEGKK